MSQVATLVCMRLKDMQRVHPYQDNSHVCSKCGERVGIYPSGQSALKGNPAMPIICAICVQEGPRGENRPAAPWSEIVQELCDSKDA